MYFWYYPTIDRFAVTKTKNKPQIERIRLSSYFCGFEYCRYIPLDDLSLNVVNRTLTVHPREICFEINRVCNLMCPICIASAGPHLNLYLTISKFEEIIRKFKGTAMRITLTGGEPSLHVDFLNFVRLALTNAIGVVIATNGYQPAILENTIGGLKTLTVTVSLQGSRDVHEQFVGKIGAFDRALDTIGRCLKLGHRVEVLTTAFGESIESLPALTKALESYPIHEHRINMVKNRGRVRRKPVSWEDAVTAISQVHPHYKLTIKRRDQPFLFVACDGKEERRNGSFSK